MSALFACREAVRLANLAFDQPLSWFQRFELRGHLFVCHACRSYGHQARKLHRAIRSAVDQDRLVPVSVRLSPEARARIQLALNGKSSNKSL